MNGMSIALLVLLSSFLVLGACQVRKTDSEEKDLAAIDELHRKDMAASKAQDIKTLIELWTEDGILLHPGQDPTRGKAAIWKYMQEQQPEMMNCEITEYVQEFEEVKVIGDWAYEWGTFKGTYRLKSGGPELHERARLFRILRRQADGSWRCSRAIWHDLPAENGKKEG